MGQVAISVVCLTTLVASGAVGQEKLRGRSPASTSETRCAVKSTPQGNRLRINFANDGSIGPPLSNRPFAIEYPPGSGGEHIYCFTPMFAALVSDSLSQPALNNRLMVVRAPIDGLGELSPIFNASWAGRPGEGPGRRGVDDDGDGCIDEDPLDGADNDGDWNVLLDDLGSDGLPDSLETSCDGFPFDPAINPDPDQDNYDPSHLPGSLDHCRPNTSGSLRYKDDKDLYTEENALPDHGEPHVDEDYGVISDVDLTFRYADTVTCRLGFPSPDRNPMGIVVRQRSFSWEEKMTAPIIPVEYTVYNVGTKTFEDAYFGWYADMDIGPVSLPGYWMHDYSCRIDELRMVYGHNPVDRGSTPLGIAFLGASVPLDGMRFSAYGPRARDVVDAPDSVLFEYFTSSFFTGGPPPTVSLCGAANELSDISTFSSIGPFPTLRPGDSIRVTIAFAAGDALSLGANNLRENGILAQELYNRQFRLPVSPPSPPLRARSEGKRIALSWLVQPGAGSPDPTVFWDEDHALVGRLPDTSWRRRNPPPGVSGGGRTFAGFRLWRSASETFDRQTFALLREFNLEDDPLFHAQSGLRYEFLDETVRPGRSYWYAVTSRSLRDGIVASVRRPDGSLGMDTLFTDPVESDLRDNALRVHADFGPATSRGEVKVVPNPYRGDRYYTDGNGFEGAERTWNESKRAIWFIDLPGRATIRIFTLVGELITTINHDDGLRAASNLPAGQEEWTLFSEAGRPIASGLYVYTVESDLGVQTGKFVIIR